MDNGHLQISNLIFAFSFIETSRQTAKFSTESQGKMARLDEIESYRSMG